MPFLEVALFRTILLFKPGETEVEEQEAESPPSRFDVIMHVRVG